MIFDFERFSRIVRRVYVGGTYTLEDVLEVFRYYFQQYEEFRGQPHPPIREHQIIRIMQAMPWVDGTNTQGWTGPEIEPFHYEALIDQHFQTNYRNCDYNINHFFSGRIRELRFYEVCY